MTLRFDTYDDPKTDIVAHAGRHTIVLFLNAIWWLTTILCAMKTAMVETKNKQTLFIWCVRWQNLIHLSKKKNMSARSVCKWLAHSVWLLSFAFVDIIISLFTRSYRYENFVLFAKLRSICKRTATTTTHSRTHTKHTHTSQRKNIACHRLFRLISVVGCCFVCCFCCLLLSQRFLIKIQSQS